MAEMIVQDGLTKAKVKVIPGETVLKALQSVGLVVESSCGGFGTCGKCKITVLRGGGDPSNEEEALLQPEEIKRGVRLACYLPGEEGLLLDVNPMPEMTILTGGLASNVSLDPLAQKRKTRIPTPSLDDQRDLVTRLLEQEKVKTISPGCLQSLAQIPYGSECTLTILKDCVIRVDAAEKPDLFGVAFDIGTTTIAAYLLDLATGKEVAVQSAANPQRKYGADVISRIHYSETNPGGVKELQLCLQDGLNSIMEELCKKSGVGIDDIHLVAIAGNTVILHTLLGVPAIGIANAPFAPVFTHGVMMEAKALHLKIDPEGQVLLLPAVSGYVGADITADLLACDFPEDPSWNGLLIDIGTNGEIVLGNGIQAFACSAAAGPAFEGANIRFGMPAVSGAVSSFAFGDQKASFEVIGKGKPTGICGSGLISIVAELITNGFLDPSGAFKSNEELLPWQAEFLTSFDGFAAFTVVPGHATANGFPIVLTQKDMREVQLAKGAIRAGVMTLLQEAKLDVKQIDEVFLAGGFGNYIDVHHACVVGLIPAELETRITRIGNGAGVGAKLCLTNHTYLEKARRIRDRIHYVELSSHLGFQNFFMDSMFFDG